MFMRYLFIYGLLVAIAGLASCRSGQKPLAAEGERADVELVFSSLFGEDTNRSLDFGWIDSPDTLESHFTSLLQNRYLVKDTKSARLWADKVNQAGVYAFVNGHITQSLSLFLDALEVSMEYGFDDPYIRANISMLYAAVQDYDKAWDLSGRSLQMFEEGGNYREAAMLLGNRLTCAMGKSSEEGVRWCLEKLRSAAYDTLSSTCFSLCRAEMFLALQKESYEEALHWAMQALACGPNSMDTVAFYASVYQDIAIAYQGLGSYDSALACFDRSIESYGRKQMWDFVQGVCAEKLSICKLTGDWRKYKDAVECFVKASDRVKQKSLVSERQNLEYMILKRGQERKMAELHYDSLYKGKVIRNQRIMFSALTALLVLALVFVYVLYRNKKRTERVNRLLYEKTRRLLMLEAQKRSEDAGALPVGHAAGMEAKEGRPADRLEAAEAGKASAGSEPEPESGFSAGKDSRPAVHAAWRMKEKQVRYLEYEIERLFDEEECYVQEDFNLDKLSNLLNSNTTYISRIVNEHFHKSFSALVNEYRIRKACFLLEDAANTGYTLEYIAKLAGFGNRVTFTQQFKRQVGMTPSEYWKIAKRKSSGKR